jgi:hypothetical protein
MADKMASHFKTIIKNYTTTVIITTTIQAVKPSQAHFTRLDFCHH